MTTPFRCPFRNMEMGRHQHRVCQGLREGTLPPLTSGEPSLIRKAGNFAKAVGKHIASGRESSRQDEVDRRLSICASCDLYDAKRDTCTHPECGCTMRRKARWEEASCPMGRWEDKPFLTIGMATYDDFEGVFYTVQALRMYQDLEDCEIIVVDNNPKSADGEATKAFIEQRCEDIATYVPFTEKKGSCPPRGHLFDISDGEYTLCLDSHVFLEAGAIANLKEYLRANHPVDDLLHGPLAHNNLRSIQATHMVPQWRSEMFGTWGVDREGLDTGRPFEIPQHGLGLFCARTSSWLKFHPQLRGFSGGEGYIHEKYRQNGRKVLCLPNVVWMHKFARPRGVPHGPILDDKIRNHLHGWSELGMSLQPIWEHFVLGIGTRGNRARIGPDHMMRLMAQCGIHNFDPEPPKPKEKPGMIIGPTSWGSFFMRGNPVARATKWDVQNSRGKVMWDGADTCLAVKCDVPPDVQKRCRRIVYMPMDQWFESREQMEMSPEEWLRDKCIKNGVTDLIVENPAVAELAIWIPEVTVHAIPHHSDPRIQPDWYDPNGPIVYSGHRCFVETGKPILQKAAEMIGRKIIWAHGDNQWAALEGAALVLAMRYPPYATDMHRMLKPAVKVANAAAAGIPVLATDDQAITTLYPDVEALTLEEAMEPGKVADAMNRAIVTPQSNMVYSQDDYLSDMMEVLQCQPSSVLS